MGKGELEGAMAKGEMEKHHKEELEGAMGKREMQGHCKELESSMGNREMEKHQKEELEGAMGKGEMRGHQKGRVCGCNGQGRIARRNGRPERVQRWNRERENGKV